LATKDAKPRVPSAGLHYGCTAPDPEDTRGVPLVVKSLFLLVRAGRLELPRPYGQQILSLPRLPFRHARQLLIGLGLLSTLT
jgi:hypothetical protein